MTEPAIPIRPRAIQLEASSACQLRCPACPTTSGAIHPAVGTGMLALDHLRDLLDANPALRQIELSNYGEIFLNPALPELLRLCHERGVATTAVNGVNLNTARPETLKAVVQYGMQALTISIDGATQETYAKYRVRGRLDAVLANIVRINAEKRRLGVAAPVLRWQFIVFGHNQHEVDDARAMAQALDMVFVPKLSWTDDLSPIQDKPSLRALMPQGAATRAEVLQKTGQDYVAGICHQLWDSPQVNWDGKLLGCSRNFWGDFGANVFQDGLVPAVNATRMVQARAMLSGQMPAQPGVPCTSCDIYLGIAERGTWLQRDDVARGQTLNLDEAVTLAAAWRASGRTAPAKAMLEGVLRANPIHPAGLRLMFQLQRPDA